MLAPLLGFRDREDAGNFSTVDNSRGLAMPGKLTPLQRAYLLGHRRAFTRMRRELYDMKRSLDDELADLRNRSERHYREAKEVVLAMAERDPDARLH